MTQIFLDNKGFGVYTNKGQEVSNGVYEFTLTRGNDVLVVETTKQMLKNICLNFDQYITTAKRQKVSSQ